MKRPRNPSANQAYHHRPRTCRLEGRAHHDRYHHHAPKAIIAGYSAGEISREDMLDSLAKYPYAEQPPTDGYDWNTPAPAGPTWMDVSVAVNLGYLTEADYAEIFERRHGRD